MHICFAFKTTFFSALLFAVCVVTIISASFIGDAPTPPPGGDPLGTPIRHRPPGQSVTGSELPLDALEQETFCDGICRAGQGDFTGSKIIQKYAGLTQQMRWGILTVLAARSPSCQHFPHPDRFLRADYPTYFGRHNRSSESAEFKSSKIPGKYEGLT
jgi:hypothetical protein